MARHLFKTLSLCLALTIVLSQAAWPMRTQNSQTTAEQPRREIKLDPKIFDAYVGQYKRDELVVVVFRDGDKFFIGSIDGPAAEILPASETGFFFKDAPVGTTIIFIKDGQGKVTHYLKKQGGQELRTDKISNQVPAEVISSNKLRPFDKQEAMIPVRDGVKLHTVIFIPKDAREPLPILI